MNLNQILLKIEQEGIDSIKDYIDSLSENDKERILKEMREYSYKEIIAVCKENENGKIISVEIDGQYKLETVNQVIKGYNLGQGYKIKNGEEVKPYDHDDKIRSHANNIPTDNLSKLPKSNKCKK